MWQRFVLRARVILSAPNRMCATHIRAFVIASQVLKDSTATRVSICITASPRKAASVSPFYKQFSQLSPTISSENLDVLINIMTLLIYDYGIVY